MSLSGAKPLMSRKTEDEIFEINGVAGAVLGLGTFGLGAAGYTLAADGSIMAGLATATAAVNMAGKVINGVQKVSAESLVLAKHVKATLKESYKHFASWISNPGLDTIGDDARGYDHFNHSHRALITIIEALEHSAHLDIPVSPSERREDLNREKEVEAKRYDDMNVVQLAEHIDNTRDEHGDFLAGSSNPDLARQILGGVQSVEEASAETAIELAARMWGATMTDLCQSGPTTMGPSNMTNTRVFTRTGAFNTDAPSRWGSALNGFHSKFAHKHANGIYNRPPGQAYAISDDVVEQYNGTWYDDNTGAVALLAKHQYPSASLGVTDLSDGIHEAARAKQLVNQEALADEMKQARLNKGGSISLDIKEDGECTFRLKPRDSPSAQIELSGTFVNYKCDPDAPDRSVTRVQPSAIRCNLGVSTQHVPFEIIPVGDRAMGVTIYEIETRNGSTDSTLKNITHHMLTDDDVPSVTMASDGPYDGGTVVKIQTEAKVGDASIQVDRPFHFSDGWSGSGTGVEFKYLPNGDRSALAADVIPHDLALNVTGSLICASQDTKKTALNRTSATFATMTHLVAAIDTYHKRASTTQNSVRFGAWSDGKLMEEIEVRAGYETTLLYVLDPIQVEVELRTFRGPNIAEMAAAEALVLQGAGKLEEFPNTPFGRAADLQNMLIKTGESVTCFASTCAGGRFFMKDIMDDGSPNHFEYNSGTLGFSMVNLGDRNGLTYSQELIPYDTCSGRTRTPAGDPVYGVVAVPQQDGTMLPEVAMIGPLDESWVQIESGAGVAGLSSDTRNYSLLLESHSVAELIMRNQLDPLYWVAIVEADKDHVLGLSTQSALFTDPQSLHEEFASRGAWIRAVVELATSSTVASFIAAKL